MQEYFAAAYILNELWPLFDDLAGKQLNRGEFRKLRGKLNGYLADVRWHEIIAIMSGLIDERAETQSSTTANFIHEIWRRNKQLAAMSLSNIEVFPTDHRDNYVGQLQREINRWGIFLPRILPLLLLGISFLVIWLLPLNTIAPSFHQRVPIYLLLW
jgi:hypothetical protein